MSSQTNGRYQGRFTARKQQSARRITGGVLALVILLLSVTRLGSEALKLLAYADIFIGGGRMLVYGNVENVDMGESLNGKTKSLPIFDSVPEDAPEDYILRLNDGTTLVYQGHTYELNRDLTTILFMGIDHTVQDTNLVGRGGQSDTMVLVGLDTKTGKTTLLNITRDAYAQVDVYSVSNVFLETRNEQITLAYAYGDGRHGSCENAMRSVSRLLFGLPISSYLALDMDGIVAANEAVGGVKLNVLTDIDFPDGTHANQGDLVELHGKNLDRYLRTRGGGLESNVKRMERHKQYLTAFASLVISRSKDNITFPVDLFSALAPYMVTNLEIPDVTFLSSTFLSHGADFSFRDIDGSYDLLNGSSVCYLDEVDLFEAVLQMFYIRVD